MAFIELWNGSWKERVVELDSPAYTIGSDPESADVVVDDPAVSRVHARLERVGTTWLVRDLGSRNGTRLAGERLTQQHRLRDRSEILVGRTRVVFRDAEDVGRPKTDAVAPAPANLTRTEKAVLLELCRPLLTHHRHAIPSSVQEIAQRLFVGKNAVQAHLVNLYAKFGLHDASVNRRPLLAIEALERGAVSIADLEARR
jgi:pSer/pThr/pTyr-binding forkhead associated (FHA) protein